MNSYASSSRPAASSLHRVSPLLTSGLLATLLLAGGCRDNQVADYRISKEHDASMDSALPGGVPPQAANPVTPPAMAAGPQASAPAGMPAMPAAGGMAASAVPTASGSGLTWTAPGTWKAKDLGQMRKGSYTVTGADGATADLSITAFPGAVGGDLANINRWRGQISLEPITATELPTASTRLVVGGLSLTVVDLVGTGAQPQRILAAMVPVDQAMWFFKLTGPDALVTAQKADFLAFLQTIKTSQ